MKKTACLLASLCVLAACGTKETVASVTTQDHDAHPHTHDSYRADVPEHKLIYPSETPDRIILNLTEDPQHSFAVNWRTNAQIATGYVEVAKETHGPDFVLGDQVTRIAATSEVLTTENTRDQEPKVTSKYHAAVITDLEPGTTYVYRVGDGATSESNWSEWFQVTMPPEDIDTPFSFVYFGDAQNQVKSMWSRVIRKSYSMIPNVSFMLHAGDLINHSESTREWGEWFYAGSFIHATVPSIMTPGNHEYNKEVQRTQLSAFWKPQFNLPKNGPLEELYETCYAVDYQNMKVISIDAQSFLNKEASRKAQLQWLDSVLQHNTKKWTTLTMHYPIFSTVKGRDNAELREGIKPLIDKYGVDLVLQGHDHTYARGYANNNATGKTVVEEAGAVYAVSVSGPKMYASKDQDWMVKRGEYTQLFQVITVTKDTLTYNAFTPLGGVYDSFEVIKPDGGSKTIVNNPETQDFMRFKNDFIKED